MSRLRPVLFTVAALAAALGAAAAPSSLLSKSPFAPPTAPVAAAEQKAGRFELRGVVAIGAEPRFSLFDTSNSKNYWLRLNETEEGVRVTGYDRSKEAVTVEVDGQKIEAVLKEMQIVAMAAPPPPVPMPLPAQGVPPGPQAMPAGAPQNEQEIQERRQRIVEELRRRRALRTGGTQAPQ